MAKRTTRKKTTESKSSEKSIIETEMVSSNSSESEITEEKPKKRRGRRKKKVDSESGDSVSLKSASFSSVPSKLKILCIFHKEVPIDERIIDSNVYIPIFGGKVNYHGDSEIVKSMLGDDTGDNISGMNRQLNEITVMYWAWKHYDEIGNPEYIGFNHYRRFIEWKDEDLSDDTVLARDFSLDGKTVYEQYKEGHVIEDFDKFSQHLKEDVFCGDSKWLRSYDRFLHRKSLYNNNIFIMPKKMFFDFMETFMSKCIDICVKMIGNHEIDLMRKDIYQRRAYSFILERMTGFYIYHMTTVGGYKVKLTDRACVNCV